VIAIYLSHGAVSMGAMVGFVTVFGITVRNSIMMISHFEHLVAVEGMSWGLPATLRGASERLVPILMTALVTGLGLLPIALGADAAGREIEGPWPSSSSAAWPLPRFSICSCCPRWRCGLGALPPTLPPSDAMERMLDSNFRFDSTHRTLDTGQP